MLPSGATAKALHVDGRPSGATPQLWKELTVRTPDHDQRRSPSTDDTTWLEPTCPVTDVRVPPEECTRNCIPRHTPRSGVLFLVAYDTRPSSVESRAREASEVPRCARSLPPLKMIRLGSMVLNHRSKSTSKFGTGTTIAPKDSSRAAQPWSRASRVSGREISSTTR